MPVKHTITFEVAVWAEKSVEGTIKKRATDRTEVSKKRKVEGSNNYKSKKKKKFTKINDKSGSNQEGKWCD